MVKKPESATTEPTILGVDSEVNSSESKDQETDPTPIHKQKLSRLLATIVERSVENPASVNQSVHDLQLWHDAQSMEDRKQLVQETKKLIERAKLTMEYLFSQYQLITQKDA